MSSSKKRTKRAASLDYNSDPEVQPSNIDAYKRRNMQVLVDSASANLNVMPMGCLEMPDIPS